MRRRDVLKLPCALAAGALAGRLTGRAARAALHEDFIRPATWWEPHQAGDARCTLCPRLCIVEKDRVSPCQARENRAGKLYTRVFGRPVTMNDDPVEKKPLFHFLPGTRSLSISNGGCNIACQFCQNWELSQSPLEQLPARFGFVSPSRLVTVAQRRHTASIALTYAEPSIAHEYNLAIAKAGRAAGVPVVMISNGYISPGPLDELLGELGAYKVDFKSFDPKFYAEICHGRLEPVLQTMQRIRAKGVWLELVHLTVPTLNDKAEQIQRLCDWVLENLGPDVPMHFTRFHPTFMLKNLPPTPPLTLERAWMIAKKAGVHYPYVGNLPGHDAENTHCHQCGNLLIKRVGYSTGIKGLEQGHCLKCKTKIPGVWSWPS